MSNNRFPLELLPDGIQLEIEQYLSPLDKANVATACQATLKNAKRLDQNGYVDKTQGIDFREIQTHSFFNSRIHVMQKMLKQAGLCILTAKKNEALAIIDKDHRLLLQVIPAITLKKHASLANETHLGRTLYQLALGTCDAELYEEIGKRIALTYGHAIKAKQFNEQFPEGVNSKTNFRNLFDSLIKTISTDPTVVTIHTNGQSIMNDETKTALQAVENNLPKPTDERTTGLHLDMQIIIDLINAYAEGFNVFKDENKKWEQRLLYWRCGFGLVERYVPYFIAMALNVRREDFSDVMEGKKKVLRTTVSDHGEYFFDPSLGVSRYIIAGKYSMMPVENIMREIFTPLKNFVERIQQNLVDLSNHCSNQPIIVCKK